MWRLRLSNVHDYSPVKYQSPVKEAGNFSSLPHRVLIQDLALWQDSGASSFDFISGLVCSPWGKGGQQASLWAWERGSRCRESEVEIGMGGAGGWQFCWALAQQMAVRPTMSMASASC